MQIQDQIAFQCRERLRHPVKIKFISHLSFCSLSLSHSLQPFFPSQFIPNPHRNSLPCFSSSLPLYLFLYSPYDLISLTPSLLFFPLLSLSFAISLLSPIPPLLSLLPPLSLSRPLSSPSYLLSLPFSQPFSKLLLFTLLPSPSP